MCLLDEVVDWNEDRIHCRSRGHLNPAHVLRHDGRLAAVHLIEFGAQAMAIHGGLLSARQKERARPGFIASVRRADFECESLQDIDAPLDIQAQRVAGSEAGWTYDYQATADGAALGSGRVSVMFIPEPAP